MTPFAIRVYKAVLSIPLGQVRTYKWVAKKAGSPKAWRAVGTILRHNPYPLIIPCHRIVKSNQELGGYIWGKNSKRLLINAERQIRELCYNKFAPMFSCESKNRGSFEEVKWR